MKVEKIAHIAANNRNERNRNINLTGFGQTQSVTQQENSYNNKKSNEAIRNQFLANVSFDGHEDTVRYSVEYKFSPVKLISSSGAVKIVSFQEYKNTPREEYKRTEFDILETFFHAESEKDGTKASGDSRVYVVEDVITESPHFVEGSVIEKRGPVKEFRHPSHINSNHKLWDLKSNHYLEGKVSVYYTDPGERLDERFYRNNYYNYVVMAPGAYYQERDWWEKHFG